MTYNWERPGVAKSIKWGDSTDLQLVFRAIAARIATEKGNARAK